MEGGGPAESVLRYARDTAMGILALSISLGNVFIALVVVNLIGMSVAAYYVLRKK